MDVSVLFSICKYRINPKSLVEEQHCLCIMCRGTRLLAVDLSTLEVMTLHFQVMNRLGDLQLSGITILISSGLFRTLMTSSV